MPHIILEYTDNIIETDFADLLKNINQILVQTLPTQLNNCKSRAIALNDYLVGDGTGSNAFVYCQIKILAGRSDEVIKKTETKLKELLLNFFKRSQEECKLQIVLEIANLSPYYSKF